MLQVLLLALLTSTATTTSTTFKSNSQGSGSGFGINSSGVFWNGEEVVGRLGDYGGDYDNVHGDGKRRRMGSSSTLLRTADGQDHGDVINIHYHIEELVFSDDDETRGRCLALGASPCAPRGRVPPCCAGMVCHGKCIVATACAKTKESCASVKCCGGDDHCRGGVCVKKCADSGKSCSSSKPCCRSANVCLSGVGQCWDCRTNGQACQAASDCCWPGSICDHGKCKGCIEVGQYENDGCKKDSDCCNKGAQCGHGVAGSCGNRKRDCNEEGDGCFWSRKCCPGHSCQGDYSGTYVCKRIRHT